jgi:UDP-N-acetylmuramate: L-alanyl-gamma-D-glutamyl-meso-diaminopimelate ligase
VPGNGGILLNGDDPNLAEFRDCTWAPVHTVGTQPEHDLQLANFAEDATGATFILKWRGEPWDEVSWSQPGLFNARNAAMAALAAGLSLGTGDPRALSLKPLEGFRGVKRRQECKGEHDDLIVLEDFGHHPTAVAATLTSLRARYPDRHLSTAFEPRSNTARTQVHQAAFVDAFALADSVYLGAVNRASQLAASERFDAITVIEALANRDIPAHTAETNAKLANRIVADIQANNAPRVLVFFTNGSFDGIIDSVTTELIG